MLEFLNNVFSWIMRIFLGYFIVAGIINFVWLILHLIFPKHIKYDTDIDFENDDGRFDGNY